LSNEAYTGGNYPDMEDCVFLPSNPTTREQDLTLTSYWPYASPCACFLSAGKGAGSWTADFTDGDATITHIKILG
jgi:hypothetical protein